MDVLYKNIRKRRLELGMNQSELAEILGYTDRSTIAKIETGVVDLTIQKVEAFAEALKSDPLTLMGWRYVPSNSDDVTTLDISYEKSHDGLTKRLSYYRDAIERLNDEGVDKLLEYADMLQKSGYVKDDSEEPSD